MRASSFSNSAWAGAGCRAVTLLRALECSVPQPGRGGEPLGDDLVGILVDELIEEETAADPRFPRSADQGPAHQSRAPRTRSRRAGRARRSARASWQLPAAWYRAGCIPGRPGACADRYVVQDLGGSDEGDGESCGALTSGSFAGDVIHPAMPVDGRVEAITESLLQVLAVLTPVCVRDAGESRRVIEPSSATSPGAVLNASRHETEQAPLEFLRCPRETSRHRSPDPRSILGKQYDRGAVFHGDLGSRDEPAFPCREHRMHGPCRRRRCDR